MNALVHETIALSRRIPFPCAEIWNAYADTARRCVWGVPAGEGIEYAIEDFREGGRESYRCGPLGSLDFHVETQYLRVVEQQLIVYAETVSTNGTPLASALVSWTLEPLGDSTQVCVTSQVASFVGAGMIEGSRSGHRIVLAQLGAFLAGAVTGAPGPDSVDVPQPPASATSDQSP